MIIPKYLETFMLEKHFKIAKKVSFQRRIVPKI